MKQKRIGMLGILLAVIVIIGAVTFLLSGSRKEHEELPQITIMFPGSSVSEKTAARVSEALSEITGQKLGCSVELKLINGGIYRSEMRRKVLGNEEADAFFVWEIEDLKYIISGGYAQALDDYMELYPKLEEEVAGSVWRIGTSSGIYAIPDNKDRSYFLGFVCRKKLLDGLAIEPDKIYTLDELHDILKAVRDAHPKAVPVVSHLGEITESIGEDMVGDGLAVLTRDEEGKFRDKFENYYASDVFYDWCKRMYGWRQEGLLDQYLTQNKGPQTEYMSMDGFGYFARVKDYVVANNEYLLGEELEVIRLSNDLIDNTLNAINWCVSPNAEYPGKTIAFLNLLFTDKEVNDLCRFGQEGIDYERQEDGTYRMLRKEGGVYQTSGWVWPELSPKELGQGAAEVSPAYGFLFDASSVQVEMDLCEVIIQKYRDPLMAGEINPDLAIPQMRKELEEAGVSKIIKEKQKQFDRH